MRPLSIPTRPSAADKGFLIALCLMAALYALLILAMLGADGTILTANQALHAVLGHATGALPGQTLRGLSVPGPGLDEHEREFLGLVRGETEHYDEVRELRTASGTSIWAEASIFAERDDGQFQRAIAFIADISELRHALDEPASA